MNPERAADDAINDRISARFSGRWEPNYVRGKLRHDPLYRAALAVLAGNSLPLLDIGCGMGLLGMYLSEHGQSRAYIGFDNDPRKIASARTICGEHFPRLRFQDGDAAALPDFAGNVAILDVLHYMPAALQRNVLEGAASRVAPGGVLLIRNCLRDRSWRYWMTVLEEKILHWTRWMQVGARHFPSREEIAEPLAASGLAVEVSPLWG
ncbi:MAG TPA: class I SAM-dependent methyltransferase, partial [Rhodanobacteraceae bacterium]|nr:class I SAM-dependent methyltransferase [Rhodanobacteraceae bacterium]